MLKHEPHRFHQIDQSTTVFCRTNKLPASRAADRSIFAPSMSAALPFMRSLVRDNLMFILDTVKRQTK